MNQDFNKPILPKNPEIYQKATSLPEISDKDIVNSKLYQDLKTKYIDEKEKSLKLKKLLYERDNEINSLKQDKLQLYNKVAMMEEQLKNYEQHFEERSYFFIDFKAKIKLS